MDYNQPRKPTTGNPLAEMNNREIAFRQVRMDFTNAVYQLTARMPVPGTVGEVLSIIEQIQADLSQTRTALPPAQAFKTNPPMWLDGTDWLSDLDTTLNRLANATGNQSAGKNVTERLHAANAHPYAPDDTEPLELATGALTAALIRARALLNPPTFTIAAECPQCDNRYAERADGARADALQAHENYVACEACGYSWTGAELWRLAGAIQDADTGGGDDGDADE